MSRRTLLRNTAVGGLALTAAGTFLSACGSSSSSSSSAVAGGGGASGAGSSLAVLQYNNAEYNELFGEGFTAAAEQLGVSGNATSGENDASTQLNTFNEALTGGIHGIGIDPVDGINIANLDKSAAKDKTYLYASWGVTPWFTPWEASNYYNYVTPDDYNGVVGATEVLAKELNGEGTVVRVRGSHGSASDLNITAAQESVLKKYPGIKIAGELYSEWTPETGQSATSSLLSRYPEANAVISQDDGIATGVVAAIQALGKVPGKDILVLGNNGAGEAVERVMAGTQLATVGTMPTLLGYSMAVNLYDLANGWKPKPGERMLTWGTVVLTKENAAAYQKRYVSASAGEQFDAKLMSRTLSPKTWDPQAEFYPANLDNQFAGSSKPSGWQAPAAYTKGMADGSFKAVAAEYKKANKIDILAPPPGA